MTGCMGSLVWEWPQERPKLFRQTLENMTAWLKSAEYIGPIDGNFIIDYKEHKPYFIEFSPRLGWNAFEALMAMHGVNWLEQLAKGELKRDQFTPAYQNFGIAVRLYVPAIKDMPILAPLDEGYQLYPKDIYRDEEDQLRVVGTEGIPSFAIIFEATGTGSTVQRAASVVYEDVIPSVTAPDLAFRDDIGEKAAQDIELLEQWGYIVHADPKRKSHPYVGTVGAGS